MDSIKRFADFVNAFRIYKQASVCKWEPEGLKRHQRDRLVSLVEYARRCSPLYREIYSDIDQNGEFSITDLPSIDKATLMENFDRVVTDARLKYSRIQRHIEQNRGDGYHLGEYRVFTTSGSTGLRGVFVFNRSEWQTAISTGLRTGPYFGIRGPRFPGRWRFACIVANSQLHVSRAYIDSVDYGIHNLMILPNDTPMEKIIIALNEFKPECLSCFSSMASMLAHEQLEGNLDIRPKIVLTSAEMLSAEMKNAIREAWGIEAFNMYGYTESGVNASIDCSRHCGRHIYEDLFIIESVDNHNNPVPDGNMGDKVLLTNLYNYTQPIIRYEISDMIALSPERCPCGQSFKLITDIAGRADEIIYLPDRMGNMTAVHPHNLRSPVAGITDIRQYQIVHDQDGLHVTAALRKSAEATVIRNKLKREISYKLEQIGIRCPEIHVNFVDFIERDINKMGKFRLIKSNLSPSCK